MSRDELQDATWLPDDLVDADDDIEILEVVGLDEDVPPSVDVADADAAGEPGEAPQPAALGESVTTREPAPEEPSPEAPVAPVAGPPAEDDTATIEYDDRERVLRLRADLENLRKRMDREREDFRLQATAGLVSRILPVLDNFERALAHEVEADAESAAGFKRGVELIHRQLMDELGREGLEPVEAVGQPFDPNHHEAVETAASDEHEPNTVLEEFQRGYLFNERLLRPALVKVSVGTPDEAGPDNGDEESSDG